METRLHGQLDSGLALSAGAPFHTNSDSLASSPSLYTGERGKSGHTAQRGAAGSPGSARRALSGTDGVISPRGPQGARSDAGVRLSRALGFACALCTPGAGYLNDNGARGKLGGEIFLCLHGLLLAAAVQQPSSPPLSISFPLSWKD